MNWPYPGWLVELGFLSPQSIILRSIYMVMKPWQKTNLTRMRSISMVTCDPMTFVDSYYVLLKKHKACVYMLSTPP